MTNVYLDEDMRELRRALKAWVKALPWLVLATLLVAIATFTYFGRQTPEYTASVKLLAGISNSSPLNVTVITPPLLPPRALESALTNPGVLRQIEFQVQNFAEVMPNEKQRAIQRLQASAALQRGVDLSLSTNIDNNGNGTYVLEATQPNPVLAAELANAAASALLAWDVQRALVTVDETRRSLEEQVLGLSNQLSLQTGNPGDRQSLLTLKSERQSQLDAIRLLATAGAVQGTLKIVTPAVTPVAPVAPLPKRNAALAALLTFFFASVFILIRSSLIRKLSNDEDVSALGIPVLARIPRVKSRRSGEAILGMLHGQAAGAAVYLQINLDLILSDRPQRVVLLTSSTPGEGKTSVGVALATSFALSGRRTLLLDVDPQISQHFSAHDAFTLIDLAVNKKPSGAKSIDLDSDIISGDFDILPLSIRNVPAGPKLENILKQHTDHYDVVLIDSPSVLEVADALRLSQFIDGVLLVVEEGKVSQRTFQNMQEILDRANAHVIGAVINKSEKVSSVFAGQAKKNSRGSGKNTPVLRI